MFHHLNSRSKFQLEICIYLGSSELGLIKNSEASTDTEIPSPDPYPTDDESPDDDPDGPQFPADVDDFVMFLDKDE